MTPDEAREQLREAIIYLVDEDGYGRADLEDLLAGFVAEAFEE